MTLWLLVLSQWTFLALRVATGAFFAISGYHKLMNWQRHETLVRTLRDDGIPFVRFCCWFVPLVEFFAGLALVVGFLTPLAALGLVILMVVAVVSDGRKRVLAWHPLDWADKVDDYLYLTEMVYIFILLNIMAFGGGYYSIDNLIGWLP